MNSRIDDLGYCGIGISSNNIQFQRSRYMLPPRAMIMMPNSVRPAPARIMTLMKEEVDDDPLTQEELQDAEISERDFECGRATDLPAEMSDEDYLAHFRSL
jgi:hypothetical protein